MAHYRHKEVSGSMPPIANLVAANTDLLALAAMTQTATIGQLLLTRSKETCLCQYTAETHIDIFYYIYLALMIAR